ncbi:hypothetical protein GCM10011390_41480 [Aureimonas endophytica]|uniref:Uncharacterized protein n=1 Tax=Aureimonas endophytica TaxID=2027858 RepID=A0A916ZXJ4_9HYPH|nr:hypothetical protein [Aureimonas endophytica]GGE18015.1 hypothetical protein GCM10011390_41480 [Aureimonas endophytica]
MLYSFFMLGPALETRYFPVVSKLHITEVDPVSKGISLVRVEFGKLRDCEYLGIAWYVGPEAGAFERVSMVPIRDQDDTSAPSRPVGVHRAGPWRVTIDAEQVRGKSYVKAYHRCHPFWVTTSDFYP